MTVSWRGARFWDTAEAAATRWVLVVDGPLVGHGGGWLRSLSIPRAAKRSQRWECIRRVCHTDTGHGPVRASRAAVRYTQRFRVQVVTLETAGARTVWEKTARDRWMRWEDGLRWAGALSSAAPTEVAPTC